eukprot:TRINITY_DN16739_c0_g1_i1.p1 TRINITY_DN16739_c0_g1~~TRINITY_DN16739_c0_g1_i1.p1  ORF type:complete len:122 (+),score=22.13 TRINITY_DN16739_c0_g1_i1:45-410(+)
MDFDSLLKYQFVYFLLGLGFNVLNGIHLSRGGKQYSPTPPKIGGTTMTLYGLSLLLGVYKQMTAYKACMVLFILVLGVFAVGNNLRNFGKMQKLYLSPITYIAGTGMNTFGMVLNAMALTF